MIKNICRKNFYKCINYKWIKKNKQNININNYTYVDKKIKKKIKKIINYKYDNKKIKSILKKNNNNYSFDNLKNNIKNMQLLNKSLTNKNFNKNFNFII